MNSNFQIAARHIGWGDPAVGGLYFVGIEQTLDWLPHELEKYATETGDSDGCLYDRVDGSLSNRDQTATKVTFWVSKIASRRSANYPDRNVYQERLLWREGSEVFNGNLSGTIVPLV